MKRKDFIAILNEVLIDHYEVHCQMKADIIKAVKQRTKKVKRKGCKPLEPIEEEIYFTDEVIEQIKEIVGKKLKGVHYR